MPSAHERHDVRNRDAGTSMSAGDLRHVTETTLAYYAERAQAFWEGTRDHDVRQNMTALLSNIEGTPPFTVLDFGCGPGRDLRAFKELGHVAIGLDGAKNFAEMARAYSGCDVWLQNFLELDLPGERFDGVFANASLFHVPTSELGRVLAELRSALRPRGVLFASNPHGKNEEGWSGGRYGAWLRPETWRATVSDAGFELLDEYYRPAGLPREQQPWLATVWRKSGRR
jgi:SAM-dependent methyltransferase